MRRTLACAVAVSLALSSSVMASQEGAETLGAALDGRAGTDREIRVAVDSPPPEAVQGAPVPDSDWELARPEDGLRDENPSSPERRRFWDRLQDNAFDQVCKQIKLKVDQKLPAGDFADVRVGAKRSLERYPDGTFALLDEGRLSLGVGEGFEVLEVAEGVSASVSVSAHLEGNTAVVRPLHGEKSCKLLGKLVDVTQFKTILPFNAKRVAAMEVGELWKLPLRLNFRVGVGVGGELADFPVSIWVGAGTEDRVSVSLLRQGEDQLRFRLRLDRAELHDRGGQILYYLPTVDLAIPGEGFLLGFLAGQAERLIGRELKRYIAARLELSRYERDGRQFMLEFMLDPRDQEQMERLVAVVKGDLGALSMLLKLTDRARRLAKGDVDAREQLEAVAQDRARRLGAGESFAGVDDYERDGTHFRFLLPFLLDYRSTTGGAKDRMHLLDRLGGEYDVVRADRGSETGLFDIPLLGQYVKSNDHESARVFTYRNSRGDETTPMAVYTLQEGFLRHPEDTARAMVRRADKVVRYAGTKGEGVNARTGLPVDKFLPKLEPAPETPDPWGTRGERQEPQRQYHRGVMAFTLVFSMKAVQDILYAPVETVLRSYQNTLEGEEREILGELLKQAKLRPDGKLEYDTSRVLNAVKSRSFHHDERHQLFAEIGRVASAATAIVRDLQAARAAKTPAEQSAAFLKVLSGEGKSGLAYEDIVRVLIQLVDPLDISSEFYVRVDKKIKGEKDLDARYLLNKDPRDGALLSGMSRTESRFAEPSRLAD